ncbi:flagellar motor switch protein FliN [Angustibacter aerolatus]
MTTTTLGTDVLAAARAAAGLVPSSAPLTPGNPVSVGSVTGTLPAGAVAVRAEVVGSRPGTVVVVVEAQLVAALAGSPMGDLPLPEALRPALEALAVAIGVGALGTGVEEPAGQALARLTGPDAVVVPLTGVGGASAWLGISAATPSGSPALPSNPTGEAGFELLQDVVMELSAELGRTTMTVRELLSLQPGAVVELDRLAGSPADLLVNGRLIARGEVVVVDEDYALKITELVSGSMQEHS